jgi:hypothetical protein
MGVMVAAGWRTRFIGDFYWHLATGQWMVKHGQVIHYNTFSYALGHTRWIADEWGFEWILGELDHLMGSAGWFFATGGLGCIAVGVSAYYLWLKGARGGKLGWLSVLVACAFVPFVTQGRGLTMSLIWLPLELIILHKARRNPVWLAALPVLMVLWINTHGSVVLGLAVVALELIWAIVPSRWLSGLGERSTYRAWLGAALVGCLGGAMITPYGWHLLIYDLGVSTNTRISALIVEWMPPDFHNLAILGAFIAVVAVLARVAWRRSGQTLDVTLAVLFSIACAHSVRFLVYAMLMAIAVTATDPLVIFARRLSMVAWWTLATVCVLSLLGPSQFTKTDPSLPKGAFTYLAEPGHTGRVLTTYDWGGYSIWRGRQTYVDGRTDLFTSNGLLANYAALALLTKNPDPTFAAEHVRYVVWEPGDALDTYLRNDPAWRLVYQSPNADVFEVNPAHSR